MRYGQLVKLIPGATLTPSVVRNSLRVFMLFRLKSKAMPNLGARSLLRLDFLSARGQGAAWRLARALIVAYPRCFGHTHTPALPGHMFVEVDIVRKHPFRCFGPTAWWIVSRSVSVPAGKKGGGASFLNAYNHGELDPVAKGLLEIFGYMHPLECNKRLSSAVSCQRVCLLPLKSCVCDVSFIHVDYRSCFLDAT